MEHPAVVIAAKSMSTVTEVSDDLEFYIFINLFIMVCFRVTLRLLRELQATKVDYDTSLVKSYMVAGNIYFYGQMREGIENVMVYRGKKKANWKMKTLDDVPDSLVDFMFTNQFKEQILTLEQLRNLDNLRPY